jgi:acetyl-CoA hydrolase
VIKLPILTAGEAAALIRHGETIGFSGFTPAGTPKAVAVALAARAMEHHKRGEPFQVGVITGASTGPSLDGVLAKAGAIAFRTPYQSNPDLRKSINAGDTRFFDMHLSVVAQSIRYGFLGKIHCGIIEACDVTNDGEIVLTTAVGIAPTVCRCAEGLIIEVNRRQPQQLRGLHDIYEPADPPHRREIPIYSPSDRIGTTTIKVDPAKIAGIVETDMDDEIGSFAEATDLTRQIGENVAEFLAGEVRMGRIPSSFLPVQSGVGDIANAVLGAMGANPDIPPFDVYTEVIQDSVVDLIRSGKCRFASGASLTISKAVRDDIYSNLDFFRPRLLLRPQEITNNPEIVRRLGLISINTAIEVDVFGNVNSTHVMGRQLMNGIGGSGDFTRNAYLSIFTCPSTTKGSKISTIVPMVSHMDHSEHSVSAVVTEHGVADLRGKCPSERAELIAGKCAHPDFRNELSGYFNQVTGGHTPQTLAGAFAMHQQFLKTGDMRGVDWNKYS